jgi:drug/metabolite transporter superfamily protein YnfA
MSQIFNGVMRAINSLLGLCMIAMGGIWILQGLNIAFLDSFMADQIEWAVYGAILALVGLAEIVWTNTRAGYYRARTSL